MKEELDKISLILKRKSILTIIILSLIIYFSLIYQGIAPIISIFYICLLLTVLAIFSWIYYSFIKKEKIIEIEKIERETELEEISKEKIGKEILRESYKKFNPNLPNFFDILENKGIKILKDIEDQIKKIKTKVYFIVESSEKPPKEFKEIVGGTTYFSYFMKELGKEFKVFRVRIFGTNSFLIVSSNGLSGEEIINRYYSSLRRKIQNIISNETDLSKKNKILRWHRNLLKNNKPIILVTQPYSFSLLSLINMLSDKVSKKDHEKLLSTVGNLLNKEVKIYKIKLGYILEAVSFNENIIKSFNNVEGRLIERLGEKYSQDLGDFYFANLLSKKDFIKNFEESMMEIDNNLWASIGNEAKYKHLKELIKSIQLNIFGLDLENETTNNTKN